MSFEADGTTSDQKIIELLGDILLQLRLLNERTEDAFETGIKEGDINGDN